MARSAWLDKLGITASLGCAVHCLVTALLFLIVPGVFQGLHHTQSGSIASFFQSEWVHIIFALIVIPVALLALWRGFMIHKQRLALVLGGLGLALLVCGLFLHGHSGELIATIAGGSLLASAHLINLRHCRTCNHAY